MTSRTVDFIYKILRGGADYGFLRAIGAPTIRCDGDAEIHMSLSGSFSTEARDASGNELSFDLLSDEIETVLVLDGVEHSLGVFLASTVTPSETDGAKELQVEAFDRCWRVRDVYSEGPIYFAAGVPYLTAIEQLLTQAGITTVLSTPTAAALSEEREDWGIGVSYLKIINDLLSEINYKPLWINSHGVAMLQPAAVPTAENIQHTMDAREIDDMVLPELSRETDIYSAANVFLVYCANPDKSGTMTAMAENTNPQSPLSIPRRGRRIMSVERVDNIADQAALQAYADKRRNDSMVGGETINVSTALMPGYGVDDVVALHYGEINGICIDKAWEMDLEVGGMMRHTLKRVVYNLD